MEWTCACCGQLAEVATWTDLTDLGWTLNGVGDCICVSCTVRQWPAAGRSLDGPQRALRVPASALRPTGPEARGANAATTAVASAFRAPAARPRPHLALVK